MCGTPDPSAADSTLEKLLTALILLLLPLTLAWTVT